MSFNDIWYNKHFLAYVLWPFSICFRGIVAIRRWLYRRGFLKVTQFPVPVVVIGNLTVGGTGKTPLTICLANLLREHGYWPGIVSRGYGAQSREFPLLVTIDSDVNVVGDEALVLVKRTHCPMAIAPDRVAAVKHLLQHSHCDVILSDDGLQHYALSRDIEIVVIDADRRFGNGWCLPAGPLREPPDRLLEVDYIVANGTARFGEHQMHLLPGKFISLIDGSIQQTAAAWHGRVVHAVAGVGNPQRFFHLLQQFELSIIEHVFPDHYRFTAADIDFDAESIVVMTEKDAVKCREFADYRHWYLPVDVMIDQTFKWDFLRSIKKLKG